MSEESSSDGGETMFVHQPPWRSNSQWLWPTCCSTHGVCFLHLALNAYLKELDSRIIEAQESSVKRKHIPPRKKRVTTSELDSVPPPGFPKWTVNKDWLKGVWMNLYIVFYVSLYISQLTQKLCRELQIEPACFRLFLLSMIHVCCKFDLRILNIDK